MDCPAFTINEFGATPIKGRTDWTLVDKEWVRFQKDGSPTAQLIHAPFVFPIEYLDFYENAAKRYKHITNEANEVMFAALNLMRGPK